jgi:hypothetical protein
MRRSALALALCFASTAPLPVAASDAVMQQWKAYALQVATPAFAWAGTPQARIPSVLDGQREQLVAQTANGVFSALTPVGVLHLTTAEGLFGFDRRSEHTGLTQSLSPLSASYAATTLVRPLSRDTAFTLTAIVARQRFATQGFGSAVWDGHETRVGIARSGNDEFSHGSGVRLGIEHALGAQFGLTLSAQSRLEMDAFKAYRGVYSEAGDFDIPGFVQSGLRWTPATRTELSLEAQRVFYSEVDTFTSAALPVRLLALLGDGSSPEFAWRDLTVYSAEVAQRVGDGSRLSLRFSSQQQPRPTSPILDRALASQYSNTNVALGLEQAFGAFGSLRFAASYSPAGYFLAATPYLQRDFDGRAQVEFEAHWTVPF